MFVQYIGVVQYIRGYHEYIKGCSELPKDFISHIGGYDENTGGC